MFYRGREHNQRLCPSKILQFPDKTVEFHRIFKQNLQQHGIVAGHTVALNHVFALFYIANDGGSVKPHPLFAARLSYSLTRLRTAFSSRFFHGTPFRLSHSASYRFFLTVFFSRYTLPPLSFGFVLLFSHGVLFPLHAPQLLLPRGLFPSLRMRRLRQKLLIVKQPAFRQSSVPHCLLHRTPRLFFMSAVSESAMLRQFLNIRMSYPSRILHPLRQVRAFPVYL